MCPRVASSAFLNYPLCVRARTVEYLLKVHLVVVRLLRALNIKGSSWYRVFFFSVDD